MGQNASRRLSATQSETSNHQQNHENAEDCDIHWENCPKKRMSRIAPLFVSVLASVGIIIYASFVDTTVTDYQPDDDNSTVLLAKAKTCYIKSEKKTYPLFFNLGLGLIGIILGTVIDRFCMFIEELCQLKSRYDGKCYKAFRASFSGIFWMAVALVTIVIIASSYVGRKTPYELKDVIYILGGIGVGSLVVYLLNLNRETKVHVSRILEEKEMSPGYTLAWSYYFNHIKPKVKKFHRAILHHQRNNEGGENEGGENERGENNEKKLSLRKLVFLLPPRTDLTFIDELISYDNNIITHPKGEHGNPYPFPIYKFRSKGDKYFAMDCIREPVTTLKEMRGRAKFFTNDNWKEEIKRFYSKMSEILANAPHDECAKMSLVVPIAMKDGDRENLRNGELSEIIVRKINIQQQPEIPCGPPSESESDENAENESLLQTRSVL